tara:strand:- start:1099 stop:3030 length:1932 start_codon:yes stop_codon:yes gene_type:complete
MNKISSVKDSPIQSLKEDSLQISKYAVSLSKFIEISDTPITIGLQGEWGTGKTSLMSLIKELLNESSIASSWVNTWEFSLFSNPETITPAILSGMLDNLKQECKNRNIWTLNDESKDKFNKAMNFFGSIANQVIDKTTGVNISDATAGSNQNFGKSQVAEMKSSITTLLDDLVNDEKNPVKKIVFFVDDLDRIQPKDAVEVLEALKNIFDIPHCVFILAIDYDVVVKGLESKFGKKTKENEREFRSFFDKIIQVPFTMPTGAYNIKEFLKLKLKELEIIISDNNIEHLYKIVSLTVGNNPRSLKRYLNSFSLIAILIDSDDENDKNYDEIDFILLFAVLGLQISYQDIFRLLLIDHNYIEWEKLFAAKIDLDLEKTEKDISKIGDSEYTNETWEKIIWGVCQSDNFLKNQTFKILELFNILREIVPNQLNDKLDKALDFASITNVDDNIAIKPVTTKGQVTYFGGFDNWINQMRTGQEENIELGLKRRTPQKISDESELFLKKWVAYFESINCDLKFTPTAGCSVQYKKRKIAQLKQNRNGSIEFLILRSFKRGYKRPLIHGVNIHNIKKYAPDDGPSYILPWGKELFGVLDNQEIFDQNENHLKTFLGEAVETVDDNNVLKVTKENHHILKEIFDETYNVNN